MLKAPLLAVAEEWLANDPLLVSSALRIYKNNLHLDLLLEEGGELSIDPKPYFQQLWKPQEETISEKIICAILWQHVVSNRLSYICQETPRCHADKEIVLNSNLLSSYKTQTGLGIKKTEFSGGNHGPDGYVEFYEPPIRNHTYFPVEFGYCHSTQMLYNLMTYRCCARLPYGADHILFFEIVDDSLFKMDLLAA